MESGRWHLEQARCICEGIPCYLDKLLAGRRWKEREWEWWKENESKRLQNAPRRQRAKRGVDGETEQSKKRVITLSEERSENTHWELFAAGLLHVCWDRMQSGLPISPLLYTNRISPCFLNRVFQMAVKSLSMKHPNANETPHGNLFSNNQISSLFHSN